MRKRRECGRVCARARALSRTRPGRNVRAHTSLCVPGVCVPRPPPPPLLEQHESPKLDGHNTCGYSDKGVGGSDPKSAEATPAVALTGALLSQGDARGGAVALCTAGAVYVRMPCIRVHGMCVCCARRRAGTRKCLPCPLYCRKAPIGVGHAFSCLTIQLTSIPGLRSTQFGYA